MAYTACRPQTLKVILFSLLFISTVTANLDLCPLNENATIANSSLTWGQVLGNTIHAFDHSSYLRPDIGILWPATSQRHLLI